MADVYVTWEQSLFLAVEALLGIPVAFADAAIKLLDFVGALFVVHNVTPFSSVVFDILDGINETSVPTEVIIYWLKIVAFFLFSNALHDTAREQPYIVRYVPRHVPPRRRLRRRA
jgi:hypothetical protein